MTGPFAPIANEVSGRPTLFLPVATTATCAFDLVDLADFAAGRVIHRLAGRDAQRRCGRGAPRPGRRLSEGRRGREHQRGGG